MVAEVGRRTAPGLYCPWLEDRVAHRKAGRLQRRRRRQDSPSAEDVANGCPGTATGPNTSTTGLSRVSSSRRATATCSTRYC